MKTTQVHRIASLLILACLLFMAAPVAAQGQQPDAKISGQLRSIEHEVSTLRQLPLKQPIALVFKTRAELQTEIGRELERSYTPAERARDLRVMVAFGLVAPGTDLLAINQKVQGEQIGGYYQTDTNQMVVVRDTGGSDSLSALDKVIFAHETTHALQDQNLGLDGLFKDADEMSGDEALAMRALPEGDASVVQSEYLLAHKTLIPIVLMQINGMSSEELDSAPLIVRAPLLFPYDAGTTFVQALKDRGGWEAVDAAYRRPPASTEQVLHPDKYLDDERPVDVTVPDLGQTLGGGWTLVDTDNIGELGIRILLAGQSDSKADANRAAAGWGGDAYRVWGNGDQTALVWRTAWDTAPDADQFVSAMGAYEAQRWGVTADNATAGQHWFVSANAVSVIVQDGKNVAYVLAPDRATAQRLLDAL